MIILAAITCVIAIFLVVLFEVTFAYIDERWDIPMDKMEWILVFWGLIFAVLICGKIMPLESPGITDWVPSLIVAAVHFYVDFSGGSFIRRSNLPPQYPPTSTPPKPPVNPGGRDVQNVPKPKSNNFQKG
jgi:hypothetical protein